MARQSDIVLENLAPGSMTRLGLGYDDVAAINPGIIYASISGYGQTGPYAHQPAHDPQIQGMSGLMDINGEPDGPPTRVGFYIGDLVTPMFAATSILAALREKERTGKGCYLDVSMMDTLASMMLMENLEEDMAAGIPLRTGNNSRSGPTGQYHASDGAIIITAASDDQWRRLCNAIGTPELIEDERFARYQVRSENAAPARAEVQARIGGMTRDEALACLSAGDVPCAPVRTVPEILADPHFRDRGALRPMRNAAISTGVGDGEVDEVVAGFPVLFDGKPLPDVPGAPSLGMHNAEVLAQLCGVDESGLERLRAEGVV
jgi:formyl-CoA transferase